MKILRSVFCSDDIDENDIQEVEQEYTSENTSINSTKLPAIYSMVNFPEGAVVLDYGGGKFDNAVAYLDSIGCKGYVYDPYNRSAEHNREVIKIIRANGGADITLCSNVLNVIKEAGVRQNVLENIKKLTKPSGKVYITVYEGKGDNAEGPTKSGYQLNRKTASYIDEVKEVFPEASRKGKLICASYQAKLESINQTCRVYPRSIKSSTDIDDLWVQRDLKAELASEIKKAVQDTMTSDLFGFEPDEVDEYSAVEVTEEDNRIKAEVRAELDYDGLYELCEALNSVIEKYDRDAYFEPVEPGIADAYIEANKRRQPVKSSAGSYRGDVKFSDLNFRDVLQTVAGQLSYQYYDDPDMLIFYVVSHKDGSAWIACDHHLGDNDARRIKDYIDGIVGGEYPIVPRSYEVIENKYRTEWTILPTDKGKTESLNQIEKPIPENISSASFINKYGEHHDYISRGGRKFSVYYNEIDNGPEADPYKMLKDFKAQVSMIAPYDDADYVWANIKNGSIFIMKGNKAIDKSYYMDADDMDIENNEWCDAIIDQAIDNILEINDKIEPRIIHNSTDISAQSIQANQNYNRYEEIASKQVYDSDGFTTDYTMYKDNVLDEYVFIFGDKDLYGPEDAEPDWTSDTEKDAWSWFNSYEGFTDDENDYEL